MLHVAVSSAQAARTSDSTAVLSLFFIAPAAAVTKILTLEPRSDVVQGVIVTVVVQQPQDFGRATLEPTVEDDAIVCSLDCDDSIVAEVGLKLGHVRNVVRPGTAHSCFCAERQGSIALKIAAMLGNILPSTKFVAHVRSAQVVVRRVAVDFAFGNHQGSCHADGVAVLNLNHTSFRRNFFFNCAELYVLVSSTTSKRRLHYDVDFDLVVYAKFFFALHSFGNDGRDSLG